MSGTDIIFIRDLYVYSLKYVIQQVSLIFCKCESAYDPLYTYASLYLIFSLKEEIFTRIDDFFLLKQNAYLGHY